MAADPAALPEARPDRAKTLSQRNWSAERGRLNNESRWTLSTAERFVLDAIEVHIAAHAEGWPTQRRLALQTGLSERQVRRVVESLLRAGFIVARVVPAGGRLPNGERASVPRWVYSRGIPRTLPCPPPDSPSTTGEAEGGGHHVRLVVAGGGHDVIGVPDMVSGEWKENTKEQNTHVVSTDDAHDARDAGESDSCSIEILEASRTEVAVRVLERWRARLWTDLRGPLESPERMRIVRARLADGFVEADLVHAIEAARVSTWHQMSGEKQRLTIQVLFGKAEMVTDLAERGRRLTQPPPSLRRSSRPPDVGPPSAPADNLASAQRLLAVLSRCQLGPARATD